MKVWLGAVALWGLWLGAAGAGVMDGVLGQLRIFNRRKPIELFAGLCKRRMNDFGRCLAGQSDAIPKHVIGKSFVRKVRNNLKNMRNHANVEAIVEAVDSTESCFDDCAASPQGTIECLLDAAINGQPWKDVTRCMKKKFRTGNIDLSVPDLGNLEQTREDLRMFMSVALYRYWDVKGQDAFWAKFDAQLRILCPSTKDAVITCVNEKVAEVPRDFNVDIRHLIKRQRGGKEQTFGGPPPVGELTLFGDKDTRDYILQKMFFLGTAGCSFHFVNPNTKGMGVLASKDKCAYAAFPKCFHYMWTLKDGICSCRTRTTSDPSLDPFEPSQLKPYIRQAQQDFINYVKKPKWKCHLKGKDEAETNEKCEKCRAVGSAMSSAFKSDPSLADSFAESFQDEISIVIDMLQKLCEIGVDENGNSRVYNNNKTCKTRAKLIKEAVQTRKWKG